MWNVLGLAMNKFFSCKKHCIPGGEISSQDDYLLTCDSVFMLQILQLCHFHHFICLLIMIHSRDAQWRKQSVVVRFRAYYLKVVVRASQRRYRHEESVPLAEKIL